MENLYNAKVSFKGEGSFAFTLPNYGELTVYAGKDIYIKGLNVSGVELLRQLRPLMLEHQLNAKPDGCYRVLDLAVSKPVKQEMFERAYKEPAPVSVADLKASLVKTTGPIIDEPVIVPEKIEEPKVEIVEEEKKEDESKKEETIQTEPKENKTPKATKTTGTKGKTKSNKKNTRKTTKK